MPGRDDFEGKFAGFMIVSLIVLKDIREMPNMYNIELESR